MTDMERLKEAHARLEDMLQELVAIATQLPNADGVGKDTYFGLGQAAGLLSKTKALLGRDIDDLARPTQT